MKQLLLVAVVALFTQVAMADVDTKVRCMFTQSGFVSEPGCTVWDNKNWTGNVSPISVEIFTVGLNRAVVPEVLVN